jgi:hypothetical protein
MSKGERKPQVPGEEAVSGQAASETDDLPAPRAGTTQLNNIAGRTANDVGVDRENVVRAQAMADAARRGVAPDLAPAADIGAPAEPTSTKRRAVINGQEVEVEVPAMRRNSAVEKFGPESRLPKGTQVRKDGTACEGDEQPYGVVGDINTPQGKLVNRVIPFDAVKEKAA